MNQPTTSTLATPSPRLWLWTALALPVWIAAYAALAPFADAVVALLRLPAGTPLAESVRFFFFDTPKVLLLLTLIVFVMGVVQTFFSAARTRALLAGRREGVGNVMAATLGIVTPFCSCSAVPLFMGFLTAGVPLGVTLSFLISAPMVNEIALGLLLAMFGWKVAALYLALGLSVAIVAGWLIGRFDLEHWVEDWVRAELAAAAAAPAAAVAERSWADRLASGRDHVRRIVGRVWPYVLVGIAVGAGIHGYVPQDFMATLMGRDAPWWAVPAVVVLGVPMYANAAGIIPVVEALLAKGAALGTVLAFMMSVVALSLPEFVILRKVLKPPLIGVFAAIVAAGILMVGYVFNAVL
jgi:uncharacterized membrane protein YraQ (UPF0718 family)